MKDCLSAVEGWMEAHFLQLNPSKTEFLLLSSSRARADSSEWEAKFSSIGSKVVFVCCQVPMLSFRSGPVL